jgi:hypothetical protein
MGTIKLVKIDNVFNYIPDQIRNEMNDDAQIKSWVLQCLRTIHHQQRFIRDISFHEIENHKVYLPEDLHSIWKVSYAVRRPTELETERLCECEAQTDAANFDLDPDCVSIYHELFITSDYYRNGFKPMAYKGKKLTDNYVCNVNWGGCHGFYSLNSTATIMNVSEASGFVAIEYNVEPKDTHGDFLVPDLPQLWEALSKHVIAKYYEIKSLRNPNLYSMKVQYTQESKILLNEVRGIFKLSNINTSIHRQLVHGKARILRAHLLTRHYD